MVNAAGAAAKKEAAKPEPEQPEITGLATASDNPGLEPKPYGILVRSQGMPYVYPGAVDWVRTVKDGLLVMDDTGRKFAEYDSGCWSAVECVWSEDES